jgi:hypothetical protein
MVLVAPRRRPGQPNHPMPRAFAQETARSGISLEE